MVCITNMSRMPKSGKDQEMVRRRHSAIVKGDVINVNERSHGESHAMDCIMDV